ncbi:tRNA nucleotidyltransferase, partial [Psychrobacter sp. 1U2]
DDLQRRDLTINAMAIEVNSLTDDTPLTGEIIDYHGGLDDIQSKTLRHISQAFSEDPLRVLRVARFYGRYYSLCFHIAEETLILMRQLVASGELAHLSAERIWQESSRATMQTSPQVYWEQLYAIGALTEYFAPLHHAWSNVHIRETVQTALYFAGQMQLNLSQRWTLLMASLDQSLFASKPDPKSSSPHISMTVTDDERKTALKAIISISNSAKVPKTPTQFASLFVTQAGKLSAVNELNATQKIDLIQACSAHKEPNKLSQLLVTSHV